MKTSIGIQILENFFLNINNEDQFEFTCARGKGNLLL